MAKRLHIYLSSDIKKSVLNKVEIAANCGLRKTLTAADIDEAVTSKRKACAKCLAVVAELTKSDDVTLIKREGWEALRDRPTPGVVSFKLSHVRTYKFEDGWNGFPPAG